MTLLLIGQGPARTGDRNLVLMGVLGKKLAGLFGCSLEQYAQHTQRFNVLPGWYGKHGKGDKFPMALAKQNARRMRASFGGCHVIFVGQQTAWAFELNEPQYCHWREYIIAPGVARETFHGAVLPHPSGIVQWWNKPSHRQMARRFMHQVWLTLTKEALHGEKNINRAADGFRGFHPDQAESPADAAHG
jgi:hypothetical protein